MDDEQQIERIDWQLCAICQENTNEPLQCPADSKRSDVGAGYSTLASNIEKFCSLKCIPNNIDVSRLNEGLGIEATFLLHKARWHKSCYAQFNSTKLKRAEKRCADLLLDEAGGKFTRSSGSSATCETRCFICDKVNDKSLHKVSSLKVDSRVKESALILNDEKLLAKVSGGDLIARDLVYHGQCLSILYRRATYAQKDDFDDNEDSQCLQGIALAEVISYIEESRATNTELTSFKLSDLVKIYRDRLGQVGQDISSRVNSTRLKERLLIQVPELHCYSKGRDVFLAFSEDVGAVLQKSNRESCDDEAMHLAKTVNVIRRDILKSKYSFTGSFTTDCQENSVPTSLLTLVNMILYGPNTQAQDSTNKQASLTISQLLQYNTYTRRRDNDVIRERRNKARETPLPIYVGVTVHAKTRSRELVEILHTLGISISYDRVLNISTDMGNEVCKRYTDDGAVCPLNLRLDLFTIGAVDNIDHNPSSTTAKDSFHGTGISLFQHPTTENPGTVRDTIDISQPAAVDTKKVVPLPETYTDVIPVLESNTPLSIPAMSKELTCDESLLAISKEEEITWLSCGSQSVCQESLQELELISWGSYHSSNTNHQSRESAVSALLPLLPNEAHSAAMIQHSMNVVQNSVNHLNPGQVPVIAFDQPLYALAKEIQWKYSDTYGERNFVIMFGGLHIEQAFLKVIGNWLEGSGWTSALSEATVTTSGTAESFLKASNIVRTRRAHQVTACCLFTLLQKAHAANKESLVNQRDALDFDQWCTQQSRLIPQFQYWFTVLQLQVLLLMFIKSLRQADFKLYINVLYKMLPWFFATNHPNYARWLPVHLRDMYALDEMAPGVAAAFKEGLFTVHKSPRKFSAIAIDQAHEQNNAIVKGDGGAVGLTENSEALRRWMVSGPEIARLVNEFQEAIPTSSHTSAQSKLHHESYRSYQVGFHKDVRSLLEVMEEYGNPFLEETQDLFIIDSKVVAEKDAVSRMQQLEATGKKQFDDFVSERLVDRKTPLQEPIKRNKLDFFVSGNVKKASKTANKLMSAKKDCTLFSRLYIACQTRDGDLDEFFRYENQGHPPSLSDQGTLRLPTKKSELAQCLEALAQQPGDIPKDTEVTIIDGAAIVNMIKPTAAHLVFDDYAHGSFLPYVSAQVARIKRIDVVWDQYQTGSLKAQTREKRGSGVRQRVDGNYKLPKSWKEFLRVDKNKQELFLFLAECLSRMDTQKQVITTFEEEIKSTHPCENIQEISPCTHEEADTRMMLHAAHAVSCGYRKIMIRTVDTDVLVLAVATVKQLTDLYTDDERAIELWVSFGTGKNHRNIPAHDICNSLSPDAAISLPVFHAFTGCDTVSCFHGIGKKTAMKAWASYPDVTQSFLVLLDNPTEINSDVMVHLERFVVLLYDRTSTKTTVNDARKQLFIQKNRQFDNIPPTKAALVEHVKRTTHQAGHIWGQTLTPCPDLPSPQSWGWTLEDGVWRPFWTTLPEVTRSCQELICCGCKKGCRGRCSCSKNDLRCTELCSCPDECDRR